MIILRERMRRGCNLRFIDERAKEVYRKQIENKIDVPKLCVFISYRGCDKEIALKVADDIRNIGVDVYIDICDKNLQVSSHNDAASIVQYIETGLFYSSHILVIVTDETQQSWWVPYEVGYAKKSGKSIASFILEKQEVRDFPDYLKIEEMLKTPEQYNCYITNLQKKVYEKSRYGGLFENSNIDMQYSASPYVKKII